MPSRSGPVTSRHSLIGAAARYDAELRPLVINHDRRLASEIDQLCRDMFGADLASHPRFSETVGPLAHTMRGAALVADLRRSRRPRLVPERHRPTCLALVAAMDDGAACRRLIPASGPG